ncbi:MAG TPA: hypothetical protein VFQ61_28505 [Polyangiaceae bacterium]|nr:hypothetical protein [Polyangiaceae bacterium]
MPRFVITGQRARASADFLLQDLPSSSGRLDVLLGCLRAGLLVSHGLRRESVVYLILNGGPRAPRVLRFNGAEVRFLRPDERSLAVLVQKALRTEMDHPEFTEVRPGIAVAKGGLECVLNELGLSMASSLGPESLPPAYSLDERGEDLRSIVDYGPNPIFFLGDDIGFDAATHERLSRLVRRTISVGPTSLYAEHALSILLNELDRRGRRSQA